MKYIKKHLKRIVPTIVLIICIFLAFLGFLHNNSQRIATQNEEYLYELTSQRAISIDNIISENLTFIASTAFLYGESLSSPWADVAVIREYEENSAFELLRFVDATGDDYTSRGVMANLADREYFQDGMRGNSGVTFVHSSLVTGERQIGFYSPVYYEGSIIGVMVGFYGEDYINRMLEYELFGYAGESWLCMTDGTVIGTSSDRDREEGNYFDFLTGIGQCSEEEVTRISNAFAANEDIAFACYQGADQSESYAVALSGVEWMLVRNFPAAASRQMLNNANRSGSMLIMELIALFLIYAIFIGIGIFLEQRKMKEANRDANDVSSGVSLLFNRFVVIDLEHEEYHYIGDVSGSGIPAQGSYEQFCRFILSRMPDALQREELSELMRLESIRAELAESDRTSLRVQAPADQGEWFTYNFIVLERTGGIPVKLLGVSQDVTVMHRKEEEEQKRLQAALDEAERASKAKTEFLFNMSHDLRTPMNAIIGYTELAQQEHVTREEMQEYIRKIDSSSLHLLSLINDILEMSRIESGKMTLDPVETNLVKVMEETKELFAAQMQNKNIEFCVDAADVQDRWVLCDEHRLNRIILNLVSNAFKFTPENGRVEVVLSQEDAVPERENISYNSSASGSATACSQGRCGNYILKVSDNGIGMSTEFVSKLFDAFERERTSTVSKTQGTGLGLSITKKIVDLMNGTIDVDTVQGEGTTFTVKLQLPVIEAPAEENNTPEPEKEEIDFSRIRLLLVEDNEINREIATLLLSQEGFMIESAENGQQALDMVTASEPGYYNVILMDIQMPVMDGYSATRAIRDLENPALSGIPIIAMTANAFQEDIKTATDAGMDAHIAKPLDVNIMMDTLTAVLLRNQSRG